MNSLIESQKNFSEVNEVNEINSILNQISNIIIDDEFSINNNGIKYKLGNDSKIISKIYEIIIIEKLKILLNAKEYKYLEKNIRL